MSSRCRKTLSQHACRWLWFVLLNTAACPASDILFQRVPDGGIQPVLARDDQGGIHLLYFKAPDEKSQEGWFIYRRYDEGSYTWSDAVQVSSRSYPRSHLIARAAMAVDSSGRIHVAWHRDRPLQMIGTPAWFRSKDEFFYTRADTDHGPFAEERSLVSEYVTASAEAGAALVTRGDTVTLVWHGGKSMLRATLESGRSVFRIVSHDNGTTFGDEEPIGDASLGACACCGLSAAYAADGRLQIAYRTAIGNTGRHMQLLQFDPQSTAGQTTLIDSWELNACPVSTNSIARDRHGNNQLVFETKGRIYLADLEADTRIPRAVADPEPGLLQKHPAIAIDDRGNTIILWNEGYDISGGGNLRWRIIGPGGDDVPLPDHTARTVPGHSAAAAAVLRDGRFLVMY